MKLSLRLAVSVAIAVAAACGGPPPTRLDRLYQGLDEALPRTDPTILEGRRILVDPGHGGYFRGTMGRDSLEESSVNLGVSLYLWGLLSEAGAEVYLTRAVDRDFLHEADSALASDLKARVDMADSLQPDIFVSIHHNAQPQRDPGHNFVETYYKAGDPASLDLAFSIHRHLMRNLGIDEGDVRQGNYYVLRENDVPSVLGESSYLTHPPVEEKIKLSDTQRLEAEAYFLGIVDYFSRGIPRIVSQAPADSLVSGVPPIRFLVEDDGGIGIDPDGIDLRVNGRPAVARYRRGAPSADTGEHAGYVDYVLPYDAANGAYEISLVARNLGGNTSRIHRLNFAIDHPATAAVFDPTPDRLPHAVAGEVHVRVRLFDRRGVPVTDGKDVTATIAGESASVQGRTRNGLFEFPCRFGRNGSLKIDVTCDGAKFATSLERASQGENSASPASLKSIFIVDGTTAAPVVSAELSGTSQRDMSMHGRYYVALSPDVAVRAPGYRPLVVDSLPGDTLRLTAWFDGVLIGKRFVLDPEAGKSAGTGPLGLSASAVNLRVARYLSGFLRDAGASVLTTRTNEEVHTPQDIARMTNRYRADRYIEIRHRALPEDSTLASRTYHFPGSGTGALMAFEMSEVLARRLPHPAQPPGSVVTYPLQQTACPAIVISYPSIADEQEELRLDSSRYLREQAYAAFAGILMHFASPDTAVVTVHLASPDAADWLITLDDTWALLPGPDGRAVFEGLSWGPHDVRATSATRSIKTSCMVNGDSTTVRITP